MERKNFKEAFMDVWDALIPMVGLNLLWVFFTLLVLTAFPAYAGLHYATNQIAHGRSAGVREFFEGAKRYFWVSWKYGLLNLIVYYLIFLNLRFYSQFEGAGFVLLQGFFVSAFVLWTIAQIYVFPFILEQTEPSVKLALRNSVAVCIRFLGRTLAMVLAFAALVVVSTLLPPIWILLTASVMAYFSNWQAISAIYDMKALQATAETETQTD